MADRDAVALVSGGAGGIGRAVSLALARGGHGVVALGRDPQKLAAVEEEARGEGLGVRGLRCDVTDEGEVSDAVAAAGPVAVLVNNAGTADTAPLGRTALRSWNEQLRVNATSAFLLTRAVLPGMRERGWGRVVFVASTAAHAGAPYTAAYTASKHAVLGLARATAAEVAGSGITSNAVCPTFARTPMTERSVARIVERTGRDAHAAERALADAAPLGRLVEPDEVAAAVAYFASAAAAPVNGQSLILDGGGIQS